MECEGYELYTAIAVSFLFAVSEILAQSDCKHNSIADIILHICGLKRIKKDEVVENEF